MLRIRKSLLHCLCLQLKPAGTLCRESSNSCDLPEFCTGANPHCPANVYLHDGHACHSVEGYCYNGICQNHEQQCITLWGPGKSKLYCVHNPHVYKGILHLIWWLYFCIFLVYHCAQEPSLPQGYALSESTLQGILMGIVGKTPKAPLPSVMRGKTLQLHRCGRGAEKLLCRRKLIILSGVISNHHYGVKSDMWSSNKSLHGWRM